MEITNLILALGSNLIVLALAWAIYALAGYLLFHRSLKACPFLIRLNLYPLLGWAFLVTFAYYLRVLALPFAISGPWCLGALFVFLVIWNRRFLRPALRRPLPGILLVLAALFALNLVPLYFRFAIPDMRDVGVWGYDQRNYVFTAAGLLDEGLLPAIPHSATPWGLLVPYWEYVKDSLQQMVSLSPGKLDWSFADLQERFETVRTASRDYAIFPRRAFSALDALMASILRLDPQQAYTLSIWMQHIWLLHVAVILSRLFHWKPLGLLLIVLLVVYWPNSHLAMAADNRDQANCLVLIFLFLIFARRLPSAFWPIVTCISAVLVGYPELAIPALVAFYAQRYDVAASAGQWITQTGKELGTCLLCLLPLLPPALLGLAYQWGKQKSTQALVFPPQYAAPLARFDYLPGWKLLWNDLPQIRYLGFVFDVLLLVLAAYGVLIVCRKKQFGSLIGHGMVLACGCAFLFKGEYYPAYKIATVLWPFFLWLLFVSLSSLIRLPESAFLPRLCGYAIAAVLIVASLPALLSTAQIPFPGSYELIGPNRALADPLPTDIKSFIRPRLSDINRLKEISHEVSNHNQDVLILTDVSRTSPHDYGFGQLLLRNESVFLPSSFNGSLRRYCPPPYPGFRPASSHQPVDRIIFLNGLRTVTFHRAQAHIFVGAFDESAFRQMNFSADLPLRRREHILVICRPGTWDFNDAQGARRNFALTDGEITLDLFNVNAPAGEVFRFSFSIFSPDPTPAGSRLEVSLNGKPLGAPNDPKTDPVGTRTVWLDPEIMHQQLVIKVTKGDPASPTPQWYVEVTGFGGSASTTGS